MTVTGDRPASTSFPLCGDDTATGLAEALFKEARQRRRRRRRAVCAGFMGALGIAFAVAAVLLVENKPTAPLGTPPASHIEGTAVAAMPSQIAVWAQTGTTMSIQVISSRSGHIVRTLASDVGVFDSTPQPAVAPDGTIYYDQAIPGTTQQGPGAHPPVEQILSVPITGGLSTFVANGHDPAVSPDGRYLAYLIWTQITDGPEGVVVVNRLTGAVTTWQYSTNVPQINTISWSPDSLSLMVSTETLVGTGSRSSWQLSIRRVWLSDPNRSLNDLPRVQLPLCPPPTPWASPGANRDMAWAGFLNAEDGIGDCHHVGLTRQDNWTRPVVVNLATGRVVRKLPLIPGLIGEGPGGGFLVDASGHHLVFVGYGLGAGGLYRWTVDTRSNGRQGRPDFVKNNVGSAGWVPSSGG
jgi:hypothetical protein